MAITRLKTRNCDLPVIHRYAEVWLNEAVELLRPRFRQAGYEIPPVHVSVGFSTDGYKPGARTNTIGVCHASFMTIEGVNEIYITPMRTEPVDVISILVHELIHAIDDCKSGHGAGFQKISRDLQCTDNLKVPLHEFKETMNFYRQMALQLGRYPRAGVRYSDTFNIKMPEAMEKMAA